MGLGHFLSGIAEGAGHIAENAVGAGENIAKAGAFAATHLDDAAKGAWKASEFVGEHAGEIVGGTAKGVGFLATHPQYWDDAAKMVVKDQLKPQNLLLTAGMVGLTVATGGIAGIGLGAKIAEGVEEVGTTARAIEVGAEAGQTAEKIGRGARFMNAVKGAKGLAEGAEEGEKVGRFAKLGQDVKGLGTGVKEAKGFEKVDKLMSIAGDTKAALKESVGLNPVSLTQRVRSGLAEAALPGVTDRFAAQAAGEAVTEGGVKGMMQGARQGLEKAAFRKIEGGYGQAREAAATPWNKAQGRIGWAMNLKDEPAAAINKPSQFAAKVQKAGNITEAIANPEDAAAHLGEKALERYKPKLEDVALKHGGAIKDKIFGKGGDAETAARPYSPYQQPVAEPLPGMQDFRLNNTRSTRTSQRIPNQAAALGTVTKESTMPTAIGPSDWYGPQQGYKTGRGFKSTSGLPSLEQPRLGQRDMVGI